MLGPEACIFRHSGTWREDAPCVDVAHRKSPPARRPWRFHLVQHPFVRAKRAVKPHAVICEEGKKWTG
eukprot:scaffold8602_cov277-Pinguiococcus_pyrenoidosus.AAC.4